MRTAACAASPRLAEPSRRGSCSLSRASVCPSSGRDGSARGLSALELSNALLARDHDLARDPAEEPVLDDAGAPPEAHREPRRVRDRSEGTVEDPVALIGLVRPTVA